MGFHLLKFHQQVFNNTRFSGNSKVHQINRKNMDLNFKQSIRMVLLQPHILHPPCQQAYLPVVFLHWPTPILQKIAKLPLSTKAPKLIKISSRELLVVYVRFRHKVILNLHRHLRPLPPNKKLYFCIVQVTYQVIMFYRKTNPSI